MIFVPIESAYATSY